jgi:hypothetical protein
MHQIYANCNCNFSAADAMDSSESLNWQRRPSMLHITRANLAPAIVQQQINSFKGSVYILLEGDSSRRGLNACELNRHRWVLQERLLAPRFLYFCCYQLFWECASCVACERYPQGRLPESEVVSFMTSEHHNGNYQESWH